VLSEVNHRCSLVCERTKPPKALSKCSRVVICHVVEERKGIIHQRRRESTICHGRPWKPRRYCCANKRWYNTPPCKTGFSHRMEPLSQGFSVRRETTSIPVVESRIQVERCMRSTRWFDGFACTKCAVPLLFHEDQSRGTSCYAPAGPLIIQCTNPACGHTQDYDGHTPEKFCLLQFQE
jgi:hypothetical protein